MTFAMSRNARHQRIVEILQSRLIRSQGELLEVLAQDGHAVTQATLSRDLVELQAVKVRKGRLLVYAVPAEGGDTTPRPGCGANEMDARLRRLCEELLVTAQPAGNLVVLRTPPGAANYLAAAIDRTVVAQRGRILGTVAGDDTVLVVTADEDGGAAVARLLLEMAAGNDSVGRDLLSAGGTPAEQARTDQQNEAERPGEDDET